MIEINKIIKNRCFNKNIKYRFYKLENKHHEYLTTKFYLLFYKKIYIFCLDDVNKVNIKSNFYVRYIYINHNGEKINKYKIYERD
jgi:hypothetical protein